MEGQVFWWIATSARRQDHTGFAHVFRHHGIARVFFTQSVIERIMTPTGTWFEVEKLNGTENLGRLKALQEVRSAEMELSRDGRKFTEDDLGASSVSYSRTSLAGSD